MVTGIIICHRLLAFELVNAVQKILGHTEYVYAFSNDNLAPQMIYENIIDVIKAQENNGSIENIAGICNLEQNCLGLMPHPERASEAILSPFGTTHGKLFFESMIDFIKRRI